MHNIRYYTVSSSYFESLKLSSIVPYNEEKSHKSLWSPLLSQMLLLFLNNVSQWMGVIITYLIWAQLLLNSYHFTDTVFSHHQMIACHTKWNYQKVEIVWIAGLFAVFFFSSIVYY